MQGTAVITKEMSFTQAIQTNPKAGEIFSKYHMGCIGCIAAAYESIEQGALAHGIDVEALIKDLNAAN